MSVVISSSMVLGSDSSSGQLVTGNNPLFGYENLATIGNLATTTAHPDYPAANLVSVATHERWAGTSIVADEYITITLNSVEDVDYVGIARHNFATSQIVVSLELFIASVWTEVVSEFIPPDDGPILMRFTPQPVVAARVKLQPGTIVPTAAVLYIGKLLVGQRRIYVGHTPITLSRRTKITAGKSESGNFLGRIVINQFTGTSVDFENLLPDWYRQYFAPFVEAIKEVPFFFAWRPEKYPYEVGYCWTTDDPMPMNQRSNGMMKVTVEMSGIT